MNNYSETDARDNTEYVLVEGQGDNRPRNYKTPDKLKNVPLSDEDLRPVVVDVVCHGPFVWRPRRNERREGQES